MYIKYHQKLLFNVNCSNLFLLCRPVTYAPHSYRARVTSFSIIFVKTWHLRLGGANNMHPLCCGGGGAQTERIQLHTNKVCSYYIIKMVSFESDFFVWLFPLCLLQNRHLAPSLFAGCIFTIFSYDWKEKSLAWYFQSAIYNYFLLNTNLSFEKCSQKPKELSYPKLFINRTIRSLQWCIWLLID